MPSREATVAVAGAGVAGLVAARHLAASGFDVQVFERNDAVGGRVRSERSHGYVFDRGFQVLFTAYPAARRELDYGLLDLRFFTPGVCIARPRHRSVLSDPFRDLSGLPETLLNTDVTVGDKWRTLALRRELARRSVEETFAGPDESTRDYLRSRGFSWRFVSNFAAPFYGGITLDRSLVTSRKVFEFTFKMLSEGRIAVPARGMGAIAEQLAAAATDAGADVHLDSPVEAVAPTGDGATVDLPGERLSVDAVVVATDPRSARELTGVAEIPTAARGSTTQYYTLPGRVDLGVGKRLLLNAADDAPNLVVPISTVAPEYAPPDETLLSATFLGTPEESGPALADRTHATLAEWFPERTFPDFELVHTDRIEFAQFDQPPGVHASLPGNDAPEGDVFLAGEYTHSSSINAAMESGRLAARAVRASR